MSPRPPRISLALLAAACAPRSSDLAGQLERELRAATQVTARLREEVLHCGASSPPDAIARTLTQVLAGTEVEVSTQGAETVVVLPVGMLYRDPGVASLRDEARPALDLFATVLMDHEGYTFEAIGHASATVPLHVAAVYGSPVDLSFQYAWALVEALSTGYGVPAESFTISARGAWAPRSPEDTDSGPYLNRRVEFRIYPPGHH
jgi:outer membrane protein OmpA-like peptidoglycan-associated protein